MEMKSHLRNHVVEWPVSHRICSTQEPALAQFILQHVELVQPQGDELKAVIVEAKQLFKTGAAPGRPAWPKPLHDVARTSDVPEVIAEEPESMVVGLGPAANGATPQCVGSGTSICGHGVGDVDDDDDDDDMATAIHQIADILGTKTFEMLSAIPRFRTVFSKGISTSDRVSRFLDAYFDRFTYGWKLSKREAGTVANGMAAYIPHDAPRITGRVVPVRGTGDCLFAALSTEDEKDGLRQHIVDWMASHPTEKVRLPSVAHEQGFFCDTLQNFAKTAYAALDFADYCAIMRLPVAEGGIWGEYLEAAVGARLFEWKVEIYVRDDQQFALIGTLGEDCADVKRILWNGGHFDGITDLAPVDGTSIGAAGCGGGLFAPAGSAAPRLVAKTIAETTLVQHDAETTGAVMLGPMELRKRRMPVATSSFPDRKRVRLSRKTADNSKLCGKVLVAHKRKQMANKLLFRKAACLAAGLSYDVFRSQKHSKDCRGWVSFVQNAETLCSVCADFERRLSRPLAALDGETNTSDDILPNSREEFAEEPAHSSTKAGEEMNTVGNHSQGCQLTPVRHRPKGGSDGVLALEGAGDPLAVVTPTKATRKRVNQTNPSLADFMNGNAQHQLRRVVGDSPGKVLVYCGVCDTTINVIKEWNAKYAIQHCNYPTHNKKLHNSQVVPAPVESEGSYCCGYDTHDDASCARHISKHVQSIRRWCAIGGTIAHEDGGQLPFTIEIGAENVRVQDAACRSSGRRRPLPHSNYCIDCLRHSCSKELVDAACRFSLLYDLADLLDVSLHAPTNLASFSTDLLSSRDYLSISKYRRELQESVCMDVPDLASAIRDHLRGRKDSRFVAGAEWFTWKAKLLKTIREGVGEVDPRKAASRALSVSLAEHIANGTLLQSNLDLGAKIAAGGLAGQPVLDGVITSIVQRVEFEERQGRHDPNMRGRHRGLKTDQMQRVARAASALAGASSTEALKMLGLAQSCGSPLRSWDAMRSSFCSLRADGTLQEIASRVCQGMLRPQENLVPIVLVFDETYLWQRYDTIQLNGNHVVVGGAWPEHAILQPQIGAGIDTMHSIQGPLASMVLDFQVKRADYYETVSVCSVPVAKIGHDAPAIGAFLQGTCFCLGFFLT